MKEKLNYTVEELIHLFRQEFPEVVQLVQTDDESSFVRSWREEVRQQLSRNPLSRKRNSSSKGKETVANALKRLDQFFSAEGRIVTDAASGERVGLNTLSLFRKALRGEEVEISADFLLDIYCLLKQTRLEQTEPWQKEKLDQWRNRWKSGLDPEVVAERQENRARIQRLLVEKIEKRGKVGMRYSFAPGISQEQKLEEVKKWWFEHKFHLSMAIRDPEELNRFLNNTLSPETMQLLLKAKEKRIPFFITPYYLSLLSVRPDGYNDEAIRCYVIYSRELVEQFGQIKAWEKEEEVVPGEPNAAGWLLPNDHNIHRRYPEVAIFIPDSMGRACGGLCAPCQRMYDFQKGHLNFDLEALKPREGWSEKLEKLIRYYEKDSQLCDILITGGDSLMSRDSTLEEVLDAVYRMAVRKQDANYKRKSGMKYAEIQRVRLGSRLPVYLPYRITDKLVEILKRFREKGEKVGIRQFFIQTHFESPLEVTEEVRDAIQRLLAAGWIVTNQLVFTVAASRRGHTARLREVLNEAGVVTYYTFSVKGFGENYALFAPNSRSLQEKEEEKSQGVLSSSLKKELLAALDKPAHFRQRIRKILEENGKPFVATDRNVMNLPGIGKSMSFTTVGITPEGKRILRFSLDAGRRHSPVVDGTEGVYIVENKSLAAYLRQLQGMGEDPDEYASVWYYAEGETESRFTLFEYPEEVVGKATFFTNMPA